MEGRTKSIETKIEMGSFLGPWRLWIQPYLKLFLQDPFVCVRAQRIVLRLFLKPS